MRIGLISDTHNDQQRIKLALGRLRQLGVTTLLHAGDVTSGRTLRLFKGFTIWIARGNMDSDPTLKATAHELFGPERLRAIHELTLDGHSVAVIHNGQSADGRELIRSGEHEVVVHGHSHHKAEEVFGDTRVINPGALGNTRWRRPTFAILDLVTNDLSWIEL